MGFADSRLLLAFTNILIPIAILYFASGFFPYKPFLPGLAQFNDLEDGQLNAAPPFDKVVFLVVDALRSDFVFASESGFKFTQQLIATGAAIPFTAHASSPTITMPRIKAITTGSVPSFLDVILNFAESDSTSSLALQDTWLAQMKAKENGKLIMYGDDTWLKLFPDTFARADGTSSFFVSDFTEVDNNVTRHVPSELRNHDWNTMIMHYLGLDHIGHKAGPRSPNMIPKQQEMDGIVRIIYESIEQEAHLNSTLLVLAGDHGMNDAGNHGGSAPGETSPALVFISPKLRDISQGVPCPTKGDDSFNFYKTIEQSDIVPALAGLLGFPVPRNNLGVFIPDFLKFWVKADDQIQLLSRNAKQILEVVKATFPSPAWEQRMASADCNSQDLSDVDELACKWKETLALLSAYTDSSSPEDVQQSLASLESWSTRAQEVMSGTASNYDVSKLVGGIGLAAVAVIVSIVACASTFLQSGATALLFIAMTLSYGGMMYASSYVEEEHHFWYWSTSAWFIYLGFREFRNQKSTLPGLSSLLLLATLRLMRRWNQTGQKFAGSDDIAKTFFPEHNFIMWIAVVATYLDLLRRVSGRGFRRIPSELATMVAIALCLASGGFKAAFTYADAPELLRGLPLPILNGLARAPLVSQARAVFVGVAIALAYFIIFELRHRPTKRKGAGKTEHEPPTPPAWIFHDLLTLLLATQSRITNIPLFLLSELQLTLLLNQNLSTLQITTTAILLQHTAFFAFGGSNAISSIDLSNAYNGVSGYNVLAVGVLTFVGNWAGTIWWSSATAFLLLLGPASPKNNSSTGDRGRGGWTAYRTHLSLLTFFVATSLLFVMLACTSLRTHLFIWTVFSPKYLYSMAWSLGQHLGVDVVIGGLLFWVGKMGDRG
ncbi:MAG: major facilitator super transporter protein [Chaenotheca gracillima]|nr:MAG: major facilitator super transporter protein [Chaenotheca gracillima]